MSTVNNYEQENDDDVTQGDSAKLSQAIRQLVTAKQLVAQAKDDLELAKAEEERLSRTVIPEMMNGMDCSKHRTSSGLEVSIKKNVKASLTDANRDDSCEWLIKNNYGRMIKSKVSLDLDKGQVEAGVLKKVTDALDALGDVRYVNKRDVHYATLSKFVRELDEQGEPIPEGVFSVYRFDSTNIKLP